MEMMATDDKPRPFHQFPGPSAPVPRMPAPEPQGLPGPPNPYEQPFRPYPTSYDSHHAEPRRVSNAPQPPIPSHAMGFTPIPGRELPQLSQIPPEPHYGRTNSMPTPTHAPVEPLPHANFHPMTTAPQDSSPSSAAPEYRSRMSFTPQDQAPLTNGDPPPPPPHSLPPAHYPTTAPPPSSQTPVPLNANYDYSSQQYLRQQRKATRAQQACDQCRSRKAKCDEGRPSCSHCKENNLQCVYKEVPPHKQDKSTQLILDRMQAIEDKLEVSFNTVQSLHVGHDRTLDGHTKTLHEIYGMFRKSLYGEDIPKASQFPVVKTDGSEVVKPEATERATGDDGQPRDIDGFQKDLNEPAEENELSIPVEHTTAAHKLLEWESIKKLLHRYDPQYVMEIEERRGFVRDEGRGEARQGDDLLSLPPSSQPTSFNSSLEGNYSRYASPTATWNSNTRYNEAPTEIRGIDEYGVISIDAQSIQRYFDSYLEHIHRLHPFLSQADLKKQIKQFIARHCPKASQSLSARDTADNRGAKRKRSGETAQPASYAQQARPPFQSDNVPPQRVRKTLDNAITLLILALGRICEVRDEPVRGPCTDNIIDYRHEPIPTVPQGTPSPSHPESVRPVQSSFYSPYRHTVTTPSPTDEKFITLPDPPDLENVDTVPGLVYYVYASNILGKFVGSNSLDYVQATLLAALYVGQLANPFHSHTWIILAARACQILTLPRNYDKLEGVTKELVCFAYWTCLQLESDILAELDLPASGISRAEARISLPQGTFTMQLANSISEPSTMMMFYYSAQTHLRKVLNRVHTDLYKKRNNMGREQRPDLINTSDILSMNLGLWRNSLPQEMKWNDTDPPSSDINVARMRAKYYGARYIIHRPLLWHAIHDYGPSKDTQDSIIDSPAKFPDSGSILNQMSPSIAPSQGMSPGDLNVPQRKKKPAETYRDLPRNLRRACKECLDSAVKSTIAFDGVKGRPVVTNIFGTAHAQFGNMLVLSIAYRSPHISELVNRAELERLLRRTMIFLLRNRNISPTLRADAKILHDIYEVIFGETPILTDSDGPN
ncbi:hypothetical protein BDV18DRAFT_111585 [Aspergillus unguis]